MVRVPVFVAALAASGLLSVAAASPSSAALGTKPGKGSAVTVKGFQFRPASVKVAPNTKVTWTNQDAVEHTVTSGSGAPRAFDKSLTGKGAKFSTRLSAPGTYEYFCARHPSMKGTVTVG